MTKLTQIIKDDLKDVGQVVKGLVSGTIQGVYTPVLLNTGIKQYNVGKKNIPSAEYIARGIACILSSCSVAAGMIAYLIDSELLWFLPSELHGKKLELVGALAVTNTIDYFVNAYKRSKA